MCQKMRLSLLLLLSAVAACSIAPTSAARTAAASTAAANGGRLFEMLQQEGNTAEAHTSAVLLSKLQQQHQAAAGSFEPTAARSAATMAKFDREAYSSALRQKYMRADEAEPAARYVKRGSSSYGTTHEDEDEAPHGQRSSSSGSYRRQQPDSAYALPRRQQPPPPYEAPSSSEGPSTPRYDSSSGSSGGDYYQPDSDAVTVCFQNANAGSGLVLNAVNRTATMQLQCPEPQEAPDACLVPYAPSSYGSSTDTDSFINTIVTQQPTAGTCTWTFLSDSLPCPGECPGNCIAAAVSCTFAASKCADDLAGATARTLGYLVPLNATACDMAGAGSVRTQPQLVEGTALVFDAELAGISLRPAAYGGGYGYGAQQQQYSREGRLRYVASFEEATGMAGDPFAPVVIDRIDRGYHLMHRLPLVKPGQLCLKLLKAGGY